MLKFIKFITSYDFLWLLSKIMDYLSKIMDRFMFAAEIELGNRVLKMGFFGNVFLDDISSRRIGSRSIDENDFVH